MPSIFVFFAVLFRTPVFNALLPAFVQLPAGCLLVAAALNAERERSNKGQGY